MFEFDSRIAVGVSGGKDSLGLLNILVSIEKNFPQSELIAVSIDEGISKYREEALSIARESCKRLNVEQLILSFDDLFGMTMDKIASSPRELGLCSYCGVLRRRALNEAARRVEADVLVTAHNLDDMAQTTMLNILRGDYNRLAIMNFSGNSLPGFVKRVKPYCEVPERESALYAYLKSIRFQEMICPYASEAMRSDVRDFLNMMEAKRPGTKYIVFKMALKIPPVLKIDGLLGRCKICGEPTPRENCRVCQLIKKFK
jgi:uncharacterized protein (TIGR00269 family)